MAKQLTPEEFLRNLGESGLFSPEEMDSSLEIPTGATASDGGAVARSLVAAGKLTPFQAEVVSERHFEQLVIGNYQVLDRLGAGGMGTVYKARHRRMKRVVAIKVLAKAAAQSEKFVQRFQREVEAVARLNHPNIVMAHDADEAEVGHFLVMEFVDGRDLETEVRARGPLPVVEAVGNILQAARAMEYAHGQGIIHRDIKPANLLRDVTGVVKVADLGLARINEQSEAQTSSLTQAGTIMGTVDYMSPEQALGLAVIDHRADIYSLGCTLYFLLTGKPPFQGPTIMAILLGHREGAIPSLPAERKDVPEALEQVFRRMVAKRPAERFGTMAEVVRALEAVAADPALRAASAGGRPTAPTPAANLPHPNKDTDTGPSAGPQTVELSPGQPAPEPATSTTVLLVEPSRSQAVIFRGYLQKLGFEGVRTSPSGQKALEAARAAPPGVVVSAMHLPDMTGVQLAQVMLAETLLSSTGFVLVTSEADARQVNWTDQAGHVVRLLKPFGLEQLGQALATATGSAVRQPLPADPDPRGRLRVLLVDDSAAARSHVRRVLTGLGIRHIIEAGDGAEAVDILGRERVDLVVSDYNMPRLDGPGLIDFIRHKSAIPTVPIIVVTTETDPARLAVVRQLGVAAICDKSFKPEVVRGVLERLG